MTIDSMRWIDKHVGIPLCWMLTGVERLLRLIRRPTRKSASKDFLFIELSEMGSMVLAYSLMEKTRKAYPDSRMFFLTFNKNRHAVDILGIIPDNNVITLDDGSLPRFLRSVSGAVRRLRAVRPGVVFDLELFSRATALLSYLSGARARVGFHRFHSEGLYRGDLLTHRAAFNPHIHIAHNLLNLLRAFESPEGEIPPGKAPVDPDSILIPRFTPTSEETNRMKSLLAAACPGIGEARRIILLNPNASDLIPIRRWPEPHYIELAERLLRVPNVFLALTGTREESAAAERILERLDSDRFFSLAGKTSFRELITLYTLCDILITNDSGPAHFSSMTDIRTYVFFGPETPSLYGPLGRRSHALTSGYACSPCVSAFNHRKTPCRDNRCLQSISPDTVFELIRDEL